MGYLGVFRAVYDYAPQSDGELAITEGDLLFVLEKSSDDDWWKAKKRAMSDEDDEPEGLIPSNYIEEATPAYRAKALYDYTKQTDEELSFSEDTLLDVYDITDPDWTLVGLDGAFGFAPANYIEEASKAATAPAMPARPRAASPAYQVDSPIASPIQSSRNPAAALAGIIAQRTGQSSAVGLASPPMPQRPAQYTPEESEEEEAPSLPRRPQSQGSARYAPARDIQPAARVPSPPHRAAQGRDYDDDEQALQPPSAFHLYNVSEMISHLGKKKKMPTTLGINAGRGLITISPAKSKDGPPLEWTAEKLTHYSIEGKHVFMELVRPSRSVDFHAGAKDTASEIVAALGDLAGAVRSEGLREVLAATSGGGGQKTGHILYEFMAQGQDEVTVAVGDDVIVLDDVKSEEWWMVRRLKNGKEGVVPSSYVEVTGILPTTASTTSYAGINAGRSVVEQNRLEEERLARESTRSQRKSTNEPKDERSARDAPSDRKTSSNSKPKPNSAKVRTWTDRSGSFKVEAEFIGLKDGKIHLHKLNGVKIAVPVGKMAIEDLEYVEDATGVSLDDEKPLSDIKRRSTQREKERAPTEQRRAPTTAGATVQPTSDYDWFDFFLQCGVNPQICEHYAGAFNRDQIGEENLPDIQPPLLRTLGLKEGDILRVMKLLDNKFGRVAVGGDSGETANGPAGGLFAGPGGALRNNTRKGRPAPAVQTNDVVDSEAFRQGEPDDRAAYVATAATPLATAPARTAVSGFDDNAWDVKPVKAPLTPGPASAPTAPAAYAPPAPAPPLRGVSRGMDELSLLSPALEPTAAPQPPQLVQAPPAPPPMQPARTGADPAFFDMLGSPAPVNTIQQQQTSARQRPQAPQQMQNGSMIAPPPMRASSAPGFQPQQTGFAPPPLQPQLTGYQPQSMSGQSLSGPSMQALQAQQMMQQQYGQQGLPPALQPQITGYQPQPQYSQMQNGMVPQQTGYGMQSPPAFGQYQQPQPTSFQPPAQQQFTNGQMTGSPFADPPRPPFQAQPTGMQQSITSTPYMQPQQTGYMQPQMTGMPQPLQPQQTGMNGYAQTGMNGYAQTGMNGYSQQTNGYGQMNTQQFSQGFGQPPSQLPPLQQQPTGFAQPQPLVAQKTGPAPTIRFGVQPAAKLVPQPTGRANLRNATPQNPFGF